MDPLPTLTFEEARVFGCLIEKSQATPEYYPMTINAIVNACNQKSSREPVVEFDEDTVDYALEKLRDKGLAAVVSGTGRVVKHMHRVGNNGLGMTPAQACALSIILLRGPQTVGEVKTRAGRQFTYPSLEFVQETIASMMAEGKRVLEEAPRRSGQKEVRYRHLFFHWPAMEEAEAFIVASAPAAPQTASIRADFDDLRATIAALEQRVTALEVELAALRAAVGE